MKKIIPIFIFFLLTFFQNIAVFWSENCEYIEGEKYDRISELKYSPDWKDFIFKAKKDWKNFIIKNGIKIYEHSDIDNLNYTPNLKEFSFVDKKNWKEFIVSKICDNNNKIKKTKIELLKQIMISKKELNKTKKWQWYIKIINNFTEKASEKKMETLVLKLEKIDTSLKKYSKIKNILDYLEAKVLLKLKQIN